MLGRKKDGKEKKPKAEKTKKVKPKKEPKPKKEKAKKEPKPKKEKPKKEKPKKVPKPKKEKKPKKGQAANANANPEEEGKKKGGLKKLLIIIPLLLAVVATGVFVVLPKIRGKADAPAEEETEQAEENTDGNAEDNGDDETEAAEDEAPEDGTGIDEKGSEPLSVSQAVNYVMTLPPSLLGLEGASMAEYDIYPGGAVVRVDGMACTELSVYDKNDAAGTNDIKGTYLLSRGSVRRLFNLNKLTKEVTEIELPEAEPEAETESPEEGEAEESGD